MYFKDFSAQVHLTWIIRWQTYDSAATY